jgi:hypothetical protein
MLGRTGAGAQAASYCVTPWLSLLSLVDVLAHTIHVHFGTPVSRRAGIFFFAQC